MRSAWSIAYVGPQNRRSRLHKNEIHIGRTAFKKQLEFFWHTLRRNDPLEKSLISASIEGKRKRGRQKTRWMDNSMETMNINTEEPRNANRPHP